MTPARGKILVRKVESQETVPGGRIIIPQQARENLAANQVEVVAVGAPVICDDSDCERPHGPIERVVGSCVEHDFYAKGPWSHPASVKPGDWVLLGVNKLVDAGEDDLYIVKQDDVLAVLEP